MTFAEALYEALFETETDEDLEASVADWSDLSAAERSFALAQLTWMLLRRVDSLGGAVRDLREVVEDVATRPGRPPDVIDAEVIDG